MIFSKGEPRSLKLNAKKNYQEARDNNLDISGLSSQEVKTLLQANNLTVHYMKGTAGMLPKSFDFQPKSKTEKTMAAEKPVELLEELIEYITLPYETILDQFGGSGNIAIASSNKNRNSIVIEKDEEMFEKMKDNIEANAFTEIEKESIIKDLELLGLDHVLSKNNLSITDLEYIATGNSKYSLILSESKDLKKYDDIGLPEPKGISTPKPHQKL